MPQIKLRIAKNGDTTVTTEGFKGATCKDVTKQLEQALGTTTKSVDTEEMYEPEVNTRLKA
jgi:hypothetical protein